MARHEISIELQAPPDEVYALLSDIGGWAAWDPSIRDIEPLDGADGTDRFAVTVGFYGKAIDQVHEIVAADEPNRLVVESTGRASGRWEFDLEPVEGGTRLGWTTTLKLSGVARLLDKGLDLALAGLVENAADGLRSRLEAPATR